MLILSIKKTQELLLISVLSTLITGCVTVGGMQSAAQQAVPQGHTRVVFCKDGWFFRWGIPALLFELKEGRPIYLGEITSNSRIELTRPIGRYEFFITSDQGYFDAAYAHLTVLQAKDIVTYDVISGFKLQANDGNAKCGESDIRKLKLLTIDESSDDYKQIKEKINTWSLEELNARLAMLRRTLDVKK